ncbi:MAG: ParA family protein [Pseudomonadota bacterium]
MANRLTTAVASADETYGAEGPRVLAVTNQKGGVGKTTTAINLGTALAAVGERVMIIDIDSQGNASTGLGIAPEERDKTIYDVLADGYSLLDAAIETDVPDLFVVSANADLVGFEPKALKESDRAFRLRNAIAELRADQAGEPADDRISYILIDCPPSLNLLTLNSLVASNAVLVPVQSEFFALEGIAQLHQTIQGVKAELNPGLEIQGIVLTMHEATTRLSSEVEAEVRKVFGATVYTTVIPRNVKVAEAPSHGKPILLYDYECKGSQAYVQLATELITRERQVRAA